MTKNFIKKISNTIILTCMIQNFTTFCQCTTCGGTTSCGSCGQTQPICGNSLCVGYPFMLPRSQGRNSARELVASQEISNRYGLDSTNGFFSAAIEYQRSFCNQQIPRYFFGQDYVDCKNLYIQGSQVENRFEKAWLADYFGLPSDYCSKVSFCPLVQNIIIDLNFYIGLDKYAEGLYAKVVMPFAKTQTELCPSERIFNSGTNNAIAGYLSDSEISRENLSTSFLQFAGGCNAFGDVKEPLKYGLITNKKLTKAGLAELRGYLGYNFVTDPDYHFGINFQLSAPTGNRPCAKYLLEPMIGNGKHWEIGFGVTGSWIFHRSKTCDDKFLGFWVDATVTHLAKSCQCRSFDIKCKNNSRYMLLEKMGSNLEFLNIKNAQDDQIFAECQYQKVLVPAINWTTFNPMVRIDFQADIAAKIAFVKNSFSFDLGYDFWARTGERFSTDGCGINKPCYNMAIKGDAFVYGYYDIYNDAAPLNATQSQATIYSGKNYPAQAYGYNPKSNPEIDNPNPDGYLTYIGNEVVKSYDDTVNVNTSIKSSSEQSILIQNGQINLDDAPSSMTHKLFAYINYLNKNTERRWLPFIGLGAEVEITPNRCKIPDCDFSSCCCQNNQSTTNNNCCSPSCLRDFCCDMTCEKRMGICQWGVWIKGGASFD